MDTNYSLRLDASNPSSLTLAGLSVTEWRDTSVNHVTFRPNQLYAGTNTPPEYVESSQAVYFNNGDYHSGYLRPDAGGLQPTSSFPLTNSHTLTIYAVTNVLAGTTAGYNSILRLFNGSNLFFSFQITENGFRTINYSTNVDDSLSYPSNTYKPYTRQISAYVLDLNRITLYVDGVQKATRVSSSTNVGPVTITQASLGAGYDNRVFTGYLHELLVYETAHTPSQRQAMEAYLSAKWNPPITLKTDFLLYQYIPIDPIRVSADGRGPVYLIFPDLPNALTFDPLIGDVTGKSIQAGSETSTVYAVDDIGTTTLDLHFNTVLPFAIRRQPNASSYTSYVRQYTLVNAAQNARDRTVLNEDGHQGQFTAPLPPDVVTQTIDPNCRAKTCT